MFATQYVLVNTARFFISCGESVRPARIEHVRHEGTTRMLTTEFVVSVSSAEGGVMSDRNCKCLTFLFIESAQHLEQIHRIFFAGRILSPQEIVKREEEFERELQKQHVQERVLIAATR